MKPEDNVNGESTDRSRCAGCQGQEAVRSGFALGSSGIAVNDEALFQTVRDRARASPL
jgi:hypothetical protein